MDNEVIGEVIRILRSQVKQWEEPVVERLSEGRDPYKILIATILSLRTKDAVTDAAARRLFSKADTAERILQIPAEKIEKLIYPVGFYRTKARSIKKISEIIIEKYKGKVPENIDELTTLPGVGRKTANLVAILGYGRLGICVDTHVHRISNRWGYVKTKTPDETEQELRSVLPKRYWREINNLLVTFGQNLCLPVSPYCCQCRIFKFCTRDGVKRSR